MAEFGSLPDGFIGELRERYPDGVSTRIVNDMINECKPKIDKPVNAKGWLIEGGAKDSAETKTERFLAAEQASKIA